MFSSSAALFKPSLSRDQTGGSSMKRAETFWQASVLLLVFLVTAGIYIVLGWLLSRIREGEQSASPTPASQPGYVLRITEPLDGAVLQRSISITVQSALTEPGFVQAGLQVDGREVAIQVNPDPQAAFWVAQWVWQDPSEGTHTLAVQAHRGEGGAGESPPVQVTVVPRGDLVFASNRDGAYAIYTMQTDGQDLVRLTGWPGAARQPAPSKDGVVAFVTTTEGGQPVIRQLGKEGEQEIDLFPGVDPTWAPDGVRLACAANREGISQVFVALTDSGTPGQVTAEEVYAGQPTWSPDGTRLAYVAEREGNWDVWFVTLDRSEPHRLTEHPAMDWAPAWSPDGSKLAFVSDRGGSHQIYVMRPDGTGVRQLTSFPLGAESPAWSPTGFWLAFVAYTGDGTGINAREIYLMRADGQNQVRLTYNSFDDTEVEWLGVP